MKKISIIIPAYNEEESIPYLYERLKKLIDSMENYEFELLFVNDGSKDKTIEKIKELRNNQFLYINTRIHFLKHYSTFGFFIIKISLF